MTAPPPEHEPQDSRAPDAQQHDAQQQDAQQQDAQQPNDTPQQTTGRDRLLAALRRPRSRSQITAAVLLAVLGFAGVVQVRAYQHNDDYAGWRQDDLIALLNSLDAASQRTENEIAQLEQTRNSLQSDTNSRRAALEQARQQANVLGILAGTLPAVGPGVRVTIQDPRGRVSTDHFLNGVEELRDAGAEAMEINDSVRVVAQTAFKDGPDGGLVVDGHALTPPYTIDAIGDPHTLADALSFTGGFTDDIESETVGGKVAVKQLDSVEIATVVEPSQPQYAKPAPSE